MMDKIKKTYLLCLKKVQNANQPQIQALRRKTQNETTVQEDMSQSSMGDSSTFDVERDHSMSASTSDIYARAPQYKDYMQLPVCFTNKTRQDKTW